MIPGFTKLFTLGDRNTATLFNDTVEITEKIDGSQFNFGRIDGVVHMRSKGAPVFYEDNNKMFAKAKMFVKSVEERLPDGVIFHGEYLQNPRHNTLEYNRVPRNHFMLFGITYGHPFSNTTHHGGPQYAQEREDWAKVLDCEAVPVLYEGKLPANVNPMEWAQSLIKESALGGTRAEGIVIKNYYQQVMIGGIIFPFLCAKLVTAEFKEKHIDGWKQSNPTQLEQIGAAFNAQPRWHKAVQYLRDSGQLTESVRDIGPVLKRIHQDIEEEEKENIKDMLWTLFRKDILRMAVTGFPEWYKDELSRTTFAPAA